MRKRRGTVFVRPGKDVTLYVPAETPPEVIDYLNFLKREGMFSQGVMDILTQYVQQRPAALPTDNYLHSAGSAAQWNPGHAVDYAYPNEAASAAEPANAAADETHDEPVNQKLDVAQIFLQAQRNSGKMNTPDS